MVVESKVEIKLKRTKEGEKKGNGEGRGNDNKICERNKESKRSRLKVGSETVSSLLVFGRCRRRCLRLIKGGFAPSTLFLRPPGDDQQLDSVGGRGEKNKDSKTHMSP